MENKSKNVFLSLIPFAVVFVVQIAVSIMAAQFMMCWEASQFHGSSYYEFIEQCMNVMTDANFSVAISLMYAVICGLIFAFWYAKEFIPKREGKRVSLVRSVTQYHPMMIPGAILLTVGMQYVCVYLMNALAMVFPSWLATYQQLTEGMGMTGDNYSVLLLLYAILIGPICEELTFRGLTLGFANRALPFWAANVLQAFLFAFLHMNMLQGTYTFLIGLVLGYVLYKSGNILLTIIIHVLFNFVGLILGNYLYMGNTAITFFLCLLVALLASYAGLELILKALAKRVNKTANPADTNSAA